MSESLTSNTLLPCPFCGGKAGIHRSHDADGMLWVGVRCQGCGAASTQDWCSPGNDCPIFYEGIRNSWNRRPAHEPSSVAVNEPVFYRCETCKEIMLAAHLVGTDSHERIEETSEGQPYQVTCGPVRPSVLSAGEYINRFLPANWMNDSSLETWFPITAEELKRLKDERAAQPPSAWRPIETAPKDREVLFWVVPLSAEETYRDTSGNPITSGAQPRVMFCRFGRWSSLSKATHWADVPTGCPSETKDAGECGACDKPGEHCANVHGICSRHGGRAHETSASTCDCDRSSSWKCKNGCNDFRCSCGCHKDH